jgi:hypothetical protein
MAGAIRQGSLLLVAAVLIVVAGASIRWSAGTGDLQRPEEPQPTARP